MRNFQLLFFAFLSLSLSENMRAQCFSEQSFFTAGQSIFTVPGDASQSFLIEIEAKGADGGDFIWSGNPQTDGGSGATMKGSFIISGGSDLLVVVGESGFDAPGSPGGGGGGGGSAVILNDSDVLIAAGAGGGGGQGVANTGQGGQANTNSPAIGGLGLGSSGGGGFNAPGGNGPASTGGEAGTLGGQGTGGDGGITAGSGGAGFGGGGGGSGTVGGGGGGYKGGDGSDGSADLNGKGGDSFINTLYSGSVLSAIQGIDGGGANNHGAVTITCIPQENVEINLVSKTDPECFGGFTGEIEVSAMGGLAPYQYALNGGTYGDSPVFTGLTAGDYTITVQDGTGTTDMLMVTLVSPSAIVGEVLNVTDNVCFGALEGSIEVTAMGGTSANGNYGYSINGSSVQSSGFFFNLATGFYVISIFDDNLCTAQLTATISSPVDLDMVVISKTDLNCGGIDDGICFVEAFGGTGNYMFSIDDGPFGVESMFFNLTGGTHIITVMDEEGCTEEVIVFLNEPEPVTFELSSSSLTCYGDDDGTIEVDVIIGTSPFQFKIDDGIVSNDSIFTGLSAGEYIITVIDSAGCEWIDDIEILNPDSLDLEVTVVMDVQCGGDSTGAVLLELQNGVGMITYSVDQTFNFSGSFMNLPAGEYMASATDTLGCTTSVPFEIMENALFIVNVDSMSPIECFGDSTGGFSLGVSGGVEPIQYSFEGSPFQDSSSFDKLVAGEYEVTVMDSIGCISAIDIIITEPSALEFNYLSTQNINCFGGMGAIDFSVVGGTAPYFYEDNSGSVIEFDENDPVLDFGTIAGDHILSIEDSNGCILLDTITVTQNDSLQIIISTLEGDNCGVEHTGLLELNAMGGIGSYRYSLNNGPLTEGVFDSLPSGNFLATVFDSLGCFTSMIISIPQLDGLVLDSISIGDVSCNGESDGFVEFFVSNANGMVTIGMDDIVYTSNLIENLSSGIYNFYAIDDECFIEIEVVINEPDAILVEVTDANLDEGYIAVEAIGGTMPYRYSIDGKTTFQDSSTFTGLELKDYVITVVDGNGCESSVTYAIVGVNELDTNNFTIYPNPAANILHVEFERRISNVDVDIINKLGKIVWSYTSDYSSISSNHLDLDVSGLLSGNYIIKLKQEDRIDYRQIVIIH